jgi:hypothetical protein
MSIQAHELQQIYVPFVGATYARKCLHQRLPKTVGFRQGRDFRRGYLGLWTTRAASHGLALMKAREDLSGMPFRHR